MRRAAPREPHPVVVTFTRSLRRVHEAAGFPGPSRLQAISEALPGRPVVLCKSTLHDNLKGMRRTLPSWEWVATFVRALRVAVEEDGLDADQLIGTVEEWRQRYVTAKQTLNRQRNAEPGLPLSAPVPAQPAVAGIVGHTAGQTAAEPPYDLPSQPFPDIGFLGVPLQQPEPDAHMPGWADTVPIESVASPGELFGDHGIELLHGAVRGDREAQSRLGILLLCRGGDPEQARWWLDDAASRGDVMARSLVGADPSRRRELAAAYAFELAQPADGTPDAAAERPGTAGAADEAAHAACPVYYEAAAEAGHPGAAYRLGALSEAGGEITQALHWYEMAAGYADARARRDRLRRRMGGGIGDGRDLWEPPTA